MLSAESEKPGLPFSKICKQWCEIQKWTSPIGTYIYYLKSESNRLIWVTSPIFSVWKRSINEYGNVTKSHSKKEAKKSKHQNNSYQQFLLPKKLRADVQYERQALKRTDFVFSHISTWLLKIMKIRSFLVLHYMERQRKGWESPQLPLQGR